MHILPLAIEFDYNTVLENLRPPRPSTASLWWMLAAFLAACLLFVMLELLSRRLRKRRLIRQSESDFEQLAMICQLTPEEIKVLKNLIKVCQIEFPDRLFTSFEIYNRCMEDMGPTASGPVGENELKSLRMIRNKIFFGEHSRLPPIRTTRELKSNQWLHLKKIADGSIFMTPVVEAGASGLLVTTPRIEGEYLAMKPGERFEIYFWRERDASYHFETEVIGQTRMQSVITVFKHVDELERTQRRRYHRIETSIPVAAIPVTREELDSISRGEDVDTKGHPGLQAYMIDISPAGFALAAKAPLTSGDIVYLELPSGSQEPAIPVLGAIVNVTRRETTGESLMHAEFAGLRSDTQERIFHFIFSQIEKAARSFV